MIKKDQTETGIQLRDYLEVIVKRKMVILTVFFASVLTTTLICFLSPKIYKATATIQNGFLEEPLIKKTEIENILKSHDFLSPIIGKLNLKIDPLQLKKAIKVIDIKDTDYFIIELEIVGKDNAMHYCEAIVNSYLNFGKAIYDQRLKLINEEVKISREQINSIQADITRTNKLITELSLAKGAASERVSTALGLLQNTLPSYQNNLNTLINQKDELKLLLAKAKEFKLIDPSAISRFPIKPNKRLNISMAGVLGLIFGFLLAFFIEYWEKTNKTA